MNKCSTSVETVLIKGCIYRFSNNIFFELALTAFKWSSTELSRSVQMVFD